MINVEYEEFVNETRELLFQIYDDLETIEVVSKSEDVKAITRATRHDILDFCEEVTDERERS